MEDKLTKLQAFNSMINFLEKYYERTNSDDIACVLSDTQFFSDGHTADPAAWQDWMESVDLILKQKK